MSLKSPELLLPAGSLDKMRAAYDFGADAIYAGQPRYSLRARNNEFKLEQIGIGIQEAHARGKKFFVTSNLLPHNDKVRTYMRDIEPVIAMKPDALIMADPGLIMLVREQYPDMPIHLSVQANTVNYQAVKFWQKVGVARIILSRELSLDEIEKVRQECPDMELEVFVHGALCIAYSGRCLLSGYFNRRDPNQGTCTNACRWNYATTESAVDANTGEAIAVKMDQGFNFNAAQEEAEQSFAACGGSARHPEADKVYLLEEAGRPGQLMPIMEDEHGTYIITARTCAPWSTWNAWSRLAWIRSRSRAAPRACTTWPAPRRPTAAPSTTRWPASRSTRPSLPSWKAWPTAALPAAFWSGAPRRTTRTTKPVTRALATATMWAKCAAPPTAGPRWK